MKFLVDLFRRKATAECPRCSGKGHVDLADIKRLQREFFWLPGACAYCKGKGKVDPAAIPFVKANMSYLTTDTSRLERKKLFKGDKAALQRAELHEAAIKRTIFQIERYYFTDNLSPDQIAVELLSINGKFQGTEKQRKELIGYVERVIERKRKSDS